MKLVQTVAVAVVMRLFFKSSLLRAMDPRVAAGRPPGKSVGRDGATPEIRRKVCRRLTEI